MKKFARVVLNMIRVDKSVGFTLNYALEFMVQRKWFIPDDPKFSNVIGIRWDSHRFVIRYNNNQELPFDMNKDHLGIDRWFPVWILDNKNKLYVRGKTFNVKDKLKRLGCIWDAEEGAWYTYDEGIFIDSCNIVYEQPIKQPFSTSTGMNTSLARTKRNS